MDFQGILGALVAIVFLGTTYVPTRKYPTYDGFIFQWFMVSGTLCVGIFWGIVSNKWQYYAETGLYVFPEGMVGGSLFAIANLCFPSIVNFLGLGIGFMLWNGSNIVMGYFVSRFGWFGVRATTPSMPHMSELGILFMLLSIATFGLIVPKLDREPSRLKNGTPTEADSLMENGVKPVRGRRASFGDALHLPEELPNFGPFEIAVELPMELDVAQRATSKRRKTIGVVLALFGGCVVGNSLTPFVIWSQRCQERHEINSVEVECTSLSFLFSQCLGMYVTSTVVFLLYSSFHKFTNRSMPRSSIRPAYVAGVVFGIGLAAQLLATDSLGYGVAYPVTAIGPSLVSMLWSALYFKEIEGQRNVYLMGLGGLLALIGITAISISM